jgi:hypothetical protein
MGTEGVRHRHLCRGEEDDCAEVVVAVPYGGQQLGVARVNGVAWAHGDIGVSVELGWWCALA